MQAFLQNLLRRNPTETFPPGVTPELAYDFERRTLCGVPLGALLDALTPFGVASQAHWEARNWLRLDYHPLGLRIELSEGVVNEFVLIFDPVIEEFPAFRAGKCILHLPRGGRLDASGSTTAGEIERHFGPADDTSPLAGRPTLEYYAAGTTLARFEFSPTTSTLISASFLESNPE